MKKILSPKICKNLLICLLTTLLCLQLQAQNTKRYEIAYKNILEDFKKEGFEELYKKYCPEPDAYGIKIYDQIFIVNKIHWSDWIDTDNLESAPKKRKTKKFTKLSIKYSKKGWLDIKEYEGKYNATTGPELKGPSHVMFCSEIKNDSLSIVVTGLSSRGLAVSGDTDYYLFVFDKTDNISTKKHSRAHYGPR